MGSIGYALAAGNAVVFKPSELTPLVGQLLASIASEALTVRNLFQVVTGDGRTGAALARSNVDKIAFTGSASTGRRVMAAASEHLTPVLLELGGKDAMIVAEDADIDKAAEAAVFGALTNSGQACVSIERVYVASAVYQQFVDKVLEHTGRVRWGRDENPHIGAMTMAKQVDIVRDHMQDAIDKGATVLTGGPDAIDGPFIPPTVMTDVNHDMKIMNDETFGPVLPIQRVSGPDEAVELANATRYGLGSSVFGKVGVRKIADKVRAGMTAVNSVQVFAAVPSLPFGGLGDSGFGRIHGDEGIREFTHVKATAEERFSLPLALASFNVPGNMYDRMRGMIQQIYGGGVVDKAGETIRKLFS
jgi:aldehyde dehydrogenase (NAD+)